MNTYDIIFRKREGEELSREELSFLISGFLTGEIPEYQMAAFLMSVFFQGLSARELADLTAIMVETGESIDLSSMGRKTVDKHSTGGVGDGVSLTLAPLAASLGVVVPMMSGRGLGHTGGTLDKLESIPGFRVDLTPGNFREQLEKIGVAMIGQTENVAPADKKMYALRDVTATVDSIPLIAASIMSKKLAEGASGLVLDVKTGSGAFMRKPGDAKELARNMIEIGKGNGRQMKALITDMSQPLGTAVGNASEIMQAIALMKGKGPEDIKSIIVELSARMLVMAGAAGELEEAKKLSEENLRNGKALNVFADLIKAQGGNPDVCDKPEKILDLPKFSVSVKSDRTGYISAFDTRKIGLCALSLGAGRERIDDEIDFSAGIEVLKKIGDEVRKGEEVAVLYSSSVSEMKAAEKEYLNALAVSEEEPEVPPLVYEEME